jgi:hypothetical protein
LPAAGGQGEGRCGSFRRQDAGGTPDDAVVCNVGVGASGRNPARRFRYSILNNLGPHAVHQGHVPVAATGIDAAMQGGLTCRHDVTSML